MINTQWLEQITMDPKIFELLKFDCTYMSHFIYPTHFVTHQQNVLLG